MRLSSSVLVALLYLATVFSSSVSASEGFIKPGSSFYFLQSLGESVRLLFTFSSEQKVQYLLELSDRRVEEMKNTSSAQVANRYQEHFRQLNEVSSQIQDKEQAVKKIKEANLRQQLVLARAYTQVPENAKAAILNAQENSSKHVATTIEAVEGNQKARQYLAQIARIQQLEKLGQVERLEQAPMEGSPNADPSQNVPRGLNESKELLPGQGLNPLNPEQEAGNTGEGRLEPAAPIEMNAPAGQN